MKSDQFEPEVPNYYGPEDGLSQARPFPHGARAVLTAGTSLFCRVQYENLEKLPSSGAHVYSANHSNILDVPIALNLPVDDIRTMVTIEAFQSSIAAPLIKMVGTYPVNKMAPSKVTKKHSVDITKQGLGNFVFPEGLFPEEGANNEIGAFKKGAAAAAVLGRAKSVVPIGIHYSPNTKVRPLELSAGLLMGASFTALGLAQIGSPILSTIGGALTGAFLGGLVGRANPPKAEYWDPSPKFVSTWKGRLGGALVGGIAGLFSHQNSLASSATAITGGLATIGLSEAWRNRTIATVKIGTPLQTRPYLKLAETDGSSARTLLTKDLHRSIGTLKAELSGVPYNSERQTITSARPKENFWNQKPS